MVSDSHRTIVDMLDDPAVGGGAQQVADCVAAYLAHDDRDAFQPSLMVLPVFVT